MNSTIMKTIQYPLYTSIFILQEYNCIVKPTYSVVFLKVKIYGNFLLDL